MKVRLCNKCGGKGEVYERQDAYSSEYVECDKCAGSGRIMTLHFKKELPYSDDRSDIGKYKDKIDELLNELENKIS